MIKCDQDNYDLLRNYVSYVSKFLFIYEWVLEAYVSDFFYLDHWARLPQSWQVAFAALSTDKLSGLLDSGVIQSRQVLPLSLLSFARCTKTFSINRDCQKGFHEPFKDLFSRNEPTRESTSASNDECSSLQSEPTVMQSNSRTELELLDASSHGLSRILYCTFCIQAEVDGKLPVFFRKHVKPKKQHEIQNLAKVINELSGYTGCRCVVDVGSGLGHLSRLLSFGYGLSVTSVEAAGTHAPKANKFDREIDRELKKKRTKITEECGEPSEVTSCLPCHVTSMIYPDTSMQDFLAIVNTHRQAESDTSDKLLANTNPNSSHTHRQAESDTSDKLLANTNPNSSHTHRQAESDTSDKLLANTNPNSSHTHRQAESDTSDKLLANTNPNSSHTHIQAESDTSDKLLANTNPFSSHTHRQAESDTSDKLLANTNPNSSHKDASSEVLKYGNSSKLSIARTEGNNDMDTDVVKTETECEHCTDTNQLDSGERSGGKLAIVVETNSRDDQVEAGTDDSLKRQSNVDECDVNWKIAKLEESTDTECRNSATLGVGSAIVVDPTICLRDIKEPKQKVSDTNRACYMSEVTKLDNTCENSNIHTDLISQQKSTNLSDTQCQNQCQTEIKYNDMSISLSKGKPNFGEEKEDKDSVSCNQSRLLQEAGFILTGLHACGDLTPTFLRFFVNCEAARGLASVGCCYMKISTDERGDNCIAGYPMSAAVKALPNHRLHYNTRELACHFADTYSQRLKDCSVHLKIHSYRAALEWLAKQLHTDFKRTAVQIPAKKTNKMDFKSYARLGLQKLGIGADLLTEDLLCEAQTMTERWQDVVAFYTIRLSLAPVVETLLLLDRMFFLFENGYKSALMPIFDPQLSPRNFVLLSWK